METIRTLVLILAAISFIIVIGGAAYEHAGIVPVWASVPPASLAMFQGDYAIAPQRFWIPIHPITMLLLITSLVFNWRTERRKYILATVIGYVIVLAVTFLVFVPELIAITQTAYGTTIDPDLARRARTWEIMSLIRLAAMFLLAIVLLYGLSKSGEPGKE